MYSTIYKKKPKKLNIKVYNFNALKRFNLSNLLLVYYISLVSIGIQRLYRDRLRKRFRSSFNHQSLY